MPKLVCAKCEIQMKIKRGGINVIEMFNDPPEPYKIWAADAYNCPNCKHTIVAGFGKSAFAEHFQEGFAEILESIIKTGRGNTGAVIYSYERIKK